MWIRLILTALLLVILTGCVNDYPVTGKGKPTLFVVHEEVPYGWASWKIYIVRHTSGACFAILNPGGEGGGNIAEVNEKVCATYDTPEREQ